MAELSYRQPGLAFGRGTGTATSAQVRDLQHDLRALGYLPVGIDGAFGNETERAVKALQHELLHNLGESRGADGPAPVRVVNHNRGRVAAVTGVVNQALVECISDMLDDSKFPKLARAEDPRQENKKAVAQLAALPTTLVPIPFLLAILTQESGLKHFNEPPPGDDDTYIVIGLDRNASEKHIITSRGYGCGQYTLFHHPPRPEEVRDFILDPAKNVQKAIAALREKFDHFINGTEPATRADDRQVEIGNLPLRLCKYSEQDPRYLKECKQCLQDAGTQNIQAGVTPLHAGTSHTYEPTQYYQKASYAGVPIRKNVGCDWPYAVRRYNGAGINSYHYQTRVLKILHTM